MSPCAHSKTSFCSGWHTNFSPEDTSTIQLSQCERHPYHALVRRDRPHHHALVRWDRPHHTAISGPPQHDCSINCNPQHQRSAPSSHSRRTQPLAWDPLGVGWWEGKALKGFIRHYLKEVDKMCNSGACSNFSLCYNGVDLAWGKILPRGLGTISIPGTPNSEE